MQIKEYLHRAKETDRMHGMLVCCHKSFCRERAVNYRDGWWRACWLGTTLLVLTHEGGDVLGQRSLPGRGGIMQAFIPVAHSLPPLYLASSPSFRPRNLSPLCSCPRPFLSSAHFRLSLNQRKKGRKRSKASIMVSTFILFLNLFRNVL